MGTKKSGARGASKPATGAKKRGSTTASARSTVSGPSRPRSDARARDALIAKAEGTHAVAAAMPFNANKGAEHGDAAMKPPRGATARPPTPAATGSTLTEVLRSEKTGTGEPNLGFNPGNLPLDRVRTDATDRALTTNQAVPVADN